MSNHLIALFASDPELFYVNHAIDCVSYCNHCSLFPLTCLESLLLLYKCVSLASAWKLDSVCVQQLIASTYKCQLPYWSCQAPCPFVVYSSDCSDKLNQCVKLFDLLCHLLYDLLCSWLENIASTYAVCPDRQCSQVPDVGEDSVATPNPATPDHLTM